MDAKTIIGDCVEVFKQNLETVCTNLGDKSLTSDTLAEFCTGLKNAVAQTGLTALKIYLEGNDTAAPWLMREERKYRFKAKRKKEVLTPFGTLTLFRSVYQADSGGASIVPLDEACGLRGLSAMREVREAALFGAAHLTPVEVSQMMQKMALFAPSPTAIKNMVQAAGTLLEETFEPLLNVVRGSETAPRETRVMVASLDGANVLLNESGVKKGRPPEQPGITSSDKSSYRNAMVGSISLYGAIPPEQDRPERLLSRYVAQMPEDGFPTFKRKFLAELEHHERMPGSGVKKILLCDGHRSIWSFARREDRFSAYEWLLDFHHASGHLSLAAEAIFGKGSDAAKVWYRKWRSNLLEQRDGVAGLLRSLGRYAKRKLPKERRQQLAGQVTFFSRNRALMAYADFRQRGLPIGSGPVEAACKSLVKQRLCRSGMRWSRPGGQPVLALRSIIKSNRWEALWPTLCKSQERAYAA